MEIDDGPVNISSVPLVVGFRRNAAGRRVSRLRRIVPRMNQADASRIVPKLRKLGARDSYSAPPEHYAFVG